MKECFDFFQTADAFYLALAAAFFDFLLQGFFESRQIQFLQKVLDSFSAHLSLEGAFAVSSNGSLVFSFVQDLFLGEVGVSRIQDDVSCEIENSFQLTRSDFKDQSDTGRGTLEIPDMRNGACQGNVAHSFTANLGARYFDTALVADGAFITHLLIFAAFAFPILCRSENFLAEETIGFSLQGSVVNRFRFRYFAVGPFEDLFRRSDADFHGIKFVYI